MRNLLNYGPMLNAYPDSMGGTLKDIADFLKRPEMQGVFSSFYILPSIFNTDLDRGFSVIDYSLNEMLVRPQDLDELDRLGTDLKLDFILNHASVLSPQFQDIIANGEKSEYKDFFINWNKFWNGCGEMSEEGYIIPEDKYIKDMFFRKPGFPLLMVRFPDGSNVPYWNTFYQEVRYPLLDAQDVMKLTGLQYSAAEKAAVFFNRKTAANEKISDISAEDIPGIKKEKIDIIKEFLESNRRYLGQMDLNIQSPLVWEFYEDTLKKLSEYGAKIVRLDAFAYAPKAPGRRNFLNDPETWDVLEKLRKIADKYELTLLPEIHAGYEEKIYEKIAEKGYMTYDFFLPGLIIDALESGNGETLARWANELIEKKIEVVNMLGCHDGIPLLDLKGLIPEERIQNLISTIVSRGGYVKDLHGKKNMYYQVNATYYSALGEDDKKMELARALQIFMPGKPQVWYLDLFAGKNDHEAVKRAGAGGHKEINRTNLTADDIEAAMEKEVVKKQIELLGLRGTNKAFACDSTVEVTANGENMHFIWQNGEHKAELKCNLKDFSYQISND